MFEYSHYFVLKIGKKYLLNNPNVKLTENICRKFKKTNKMKNIFAAVVLLSVTYGCNAQKKQPLKQPKYEVTKTEKEWRKQLTAMQFNVLREAGTERPYTGSTWNNHKTGTYVCAACNQTLFSSATKFESGTGWPSFWQPLDKKHVEEDTDVTLGMPRTEVKCSRCGGHLGHVFTDGPKPTGLRYCMNSAAMKFIKS